MRAGPPPGRPPPPGRSPPHLGDPPPTREVPPKPGSPPPAREVPPPPGRSPPLAREVHPPHQGSHPYQGGPPHQRGPPPTREVTPHQGGAFFCRTPLNTPSGTPIFLSGAVLRHALRLALLPTRGLSACPGRAAPSLRHKSRLDTTRSCLSRLSGPWASYTGLSTENGW